MAPKKKKKADAGPEDDSPEVLAAIEKQKMTVEVRAAAATTLSLASSRSLLKYLTLGWAFSDGSPEPSDENAAPRTGATPWPVGSADSLSVAGADDVAKIGHV